MSNNKASHDISILVVDDEKHVLSAIRRSLHSLSCNVFTAASGKDALVIMRENPEIALVISDMYMPGKSGIELLAAIHAQYPKAKRILLTGQPDLSTVLPSIEAGIVTRFVTKPWDSEKLLNTVRRILSQSNDDPPR